MVIGTRSDQRSPSPTSSERSSSVSRLARSKPNEELLRKDKSYRRYATNIERVLSLFDTALQEWADYISFLGRLLKALQGHPPSVRVVPLKNTVAKRLAQSLNPSLPSGVHQKALEIYEYIFELIGTDSLSNDLPLYLPGLCPALSFASLSVRPLILSIWKTYLVKVRPGILRPALKAIVLALLPGLEEESSDDFQTVLDLVESFRTVVNEGNAFRDGGEQATKGEYFWQCFFLASIASCSRRQGVLAFLSRRLPRSSDALVKSPTSAPNGTSDKKLGISDLSSSIETVLYPEPGLLIRCFVSGLSDEQMLIQRGFLDLLITHLPLHSHVIQTRITSEDRELLISAAVGVVARRDMSLNRRLWSWILGPDANKTDAMDSAPNSPTGPGHGPVPSDSPSGSRQNRYFQLYGLEPLVSSILRIIKQDEPMPAARARVFRTCLSLMDRWEVGSLVIPQVFMPLMDYVRRYEGEASSKENFLEVFRSANMFFDGVECGLIWGEILKILVASIADRSLDVGQRKEKLELVRFITTRFNITDEEMLVFHLPIILLASVALVRASSRDLLSDSKVYNREPCLILKDILSLVEHLAVLVPERAFLAESLKSSQSPLPFQISQSTLGDEATARIMQFYDHYQGISETSGALCSPKVTGELLLRESSLLVQEALESPENIVLLEHSLKLVYLLLTRIAIPIALNKPDLFSALQKSLGDAQPHSEEAPSFEILAAQIDVICALAYRRLHGREPCLSQSQVITLLPILVRQLWAHLSPTSIKFHVEAVQYFWHLQSILPTQDRSIKACICVMMAKSMPHVSLRLDEAETGRQFALLWIHSFQSQSKMSEPVTEVQQVLDKSRTHHQHLSAKSKYEVMLSRPLFLLLDALSDEGTKSFLWARSWLQSLPNVEKLFRFLAGELLAFGLLQSPFPAADQSELVSEEEYDLARTIYQLQTLSSMFRCCTSETWAILASEYVAVAEDIDVETLFKCGFEAETTLLAFFSHICVRAVTASQMLTPKKDVSLLSKFQHIALSMFHQLLTTPYAPTLAKYHFEHNIIELLLSSMDRTDYSIQAPLLDAALAALTIQAVRESQASTENQRISLSKETIKNSRQSLSSDRDVTEHARPAQSSSPQLGKCLLAAFSSKPDGPVLESWVGFLTACLPIFGETIFQVLIPLVECLCAQVLQSLEGLNSIFDDKREGSSTASDASILALLTALEPTLAYAHSLIAEGEIKAGTTKGPGPSQGFLGNVVSGVFTSDSPQTRNAAANNRLTVILSFKDTVRTCFEIWSWSHLRTLRTGQEIPSSATLLYTSSRIKNKARRLLEPLFLAEPLECMESLVELWCKFPSIDRENRRQAVITVLHVLDGSKPKISMPAIFNALYSRTNPNALDPSRKSTLTSSLVDTDLAAFLSDYAWSVDDDAMDEIWTDCMTFLRDVLSNPFPHRQVLSRLLDFTAILGEKVNNTSFGDQRMRRDLSDLFLRLLTATFTVKPMGFSQEHAPSTFLGNTGDGSQKTERSKEVKMTRNDDVVAILAAIVPKLPKVLSDSDRIIGAVQIISTSVLGPAFRSRFFPDNFSTDMVTLLYRLTGLPNAQKFWKKDVAEAFNHQRFYSTSTSIVKHHWLPLIRQWTLGDNDRIPELLARLVHPTTAGIMFGVGASSARLEADRKAQLNLRRIALVILASAHDSFVPNLPAMQEKIEELLAATLATSPSSATRAEIYMVIRAIILMFSSTHLSSLWSILSPELQAAISSVLPGERSTVFSELSVFQACKLLDTLVVIAPEEFQLQEWLFITDNIDAIYRPPVWRPIALVDEVAEELGTVTVPESPAPALGEVDMKGSKSSRKPLLTAGALGNDMDKDEFLGKILRPFFGQLSIYAFESSYSMGVPDLEACVDELLIDLFDESTIVGA